MMTDAEKRVMINLELLYDKWLREWAEHVRNDTQPTRDGEREHILALKTIITNHVGVDLVNLEGYLK